MHIKTLILYTLLLCLSCHDNIISPSNLKITSQARTPDPAMDANPYHKINEIPLPVGFQRARGIEASFTGWLRNVKLKQDKTVYDGQPKGNQEAQFAVLDISVGDQDLQHCADAVMRIRAEYLFSAGRYQDIHFADYAGKNYQFSEPYTHENLWRYLQKVFSRCGSASLAKQLNSISFKDIQLGDVIIRGGFPGHAATVMDVATNKDGMKIYQLAQSFMPAQDIHVLVNPADSNLSPWYLCNNKPLVETPEYIFKKDELMRWP
ncbi:MAG: DUF4846 domain-containing protein [Ferruginibacter sp.]